MALRSLTAFVAFACIALVSADYGVGSRKILQSTNPNGGVTVTVSAASPRIDAIAITPALPYPQTGIFCNVTGDSRIPAAGSFFPLTVRVPVGVEALVVFANVTGTIPGTGAAGAACSSVVQQPGTTVRQNTTSVVQQPGTSVVQQPGTSVVQQPGTSVVQQPGTSVVQQPGTSVVQQPGTSVVQQPGTSVTQPGTTAANCTSSVVQQPGTSVVQQPGTSVVQQPGTSVVQQPGTSVVQQPGTSVVQQPGTSVVQQPGTSVVQQPGTSVVQQPGTSVVQQPGTSVVQQQSSSVVQQPRTPGTSPPASSVVQQTGRRLLQAPAPVEFISNNGSMGQPQLTVTDTVEGVPNIRFKPTAAGQTASFTGALQVAVTTTNDGFGLPYIPYRVDSRISPNCGVTVRFVTV